MPDIHFMLLCQLTVFVATIPNLSRVFDTHTHTHTHTHTGKFMDYACSYSSVLSSTPPFFLLSFFPLCKAMRSCWCKGCQVICAKTLVPGLHPTGEMLLILNSLLLKSVQILRCHNQWHTLGNDTLFLRQSNAEPQFMLVLALFSASRLVTFECRICTSRKLFPRHHCFPSSLPCLYRHIQEI
jgi:hypothetical protein